MTDKIDNLKEVFTDIYRNNSWKDSESVSGPGSNLEQTAAIREMLPVVCKGLRVTSLLNIPAGDLYWWYKMEDMAHIHTTHADIVPEIVEGFKAKVEDVGDKWAVLDIIKDPLPKADLVLVRDCLGHLSNINVDRALENLKASGSTYLLTTHFPDSKWKKDADIKDGGWRPIDLDIQFGLGAPIMTISEQLIYPGEGNYRDKALALWRIN